MPNQELNVPEKREASDETTRAGRTYVPQVDIYETKDGLWLWADMPGVDEQSVDVRLADGVLTIEGQVDVKQYENTTPLYTEYNVGHYARAVHPFERRRRRSHRGAHAKRRARARDPQVRTGQAPADHAHPVAPPEHPPHHGVEPIRAVVF